MQLIWALHEMESKKPSDANFADFIKPKEHEFKFRLIKADDFPKVLKGIYISKTTGMEKFLIPY